MLKIGMSDCGEKNVNYIRYISRIPDASITVLSKDNLSETEICDGLVLTGGEDVSPELYGDWPDETVHTNPERDGVEYRLIEIASNRGSPILGICRGLQVVNVYFGGTLIMDLEKYQKRFHRSISDAEDRYHNVELSEESKLFGYTRNRHGVVSSSHHQAADRIGEGLMVTSRAGDGTVESIESTSSMSPGLIAVQWHPERMRFEDPFALGVLKLFESSLADRMSGNGPSGIQGTSKGSEVSSNDTFFTQQSP